MQVKMMKTYIVRVPIYAEVELIVESDLEPDETLLDKIREELTIQDLDVTIDSTNSSVYVNGQPQVVNSLEDIKSTDFTMQALIIDYETEEIITEF